MIYDTIEDYNTVHAQQNLEQLNKILKTLNELYAEAYSRRSGSKGSSNTGEIVDIPNEAEFRSYYILYQLDNEGEVANT